MKLIQSSYESNATLLLMFLISFPTLHATIITDTITSRIINATADQVWPYIEDFCNIYLYAPIDVSFCTTGVPNEPGLVRYIAVKGPPPTGGNSTIVLWEQHQLASISSKNHSFELLLLSTNRPCSNYNAVIQVVENGLGTQIKWTYNIGANELCTQERFSATITFVAGQMATNIENAIASST